MFLRTWPLLDERSDDRTKVEHFVVGKQAAFYDVASSAGENDIVKRVANSTVFAVPSWRIGFGKWSAAVDTVNTGVHDGFHLIKRELVPTAFLLVRAVVFDFAAGFAKIALTRGMPLLGPKNLKRLPLVAEITFSSVLLRQRCWRRESYSH